MRFIRKVSWRRFFGDRRGNIAIISALAMPVIVGSLGVGAEVSSWYASKRALQDAADSAAVAAATNAGSTYVAEAKAVAAKYGFVHGADEVTVTALSGQACPSGGSNCYRVTVKKMQPLLLAQVVGFQGDGLVDGQPAKLLQATALAIQGPSTREYCLLALAGSGATQGIRANGVPKADLTGCNVMSNTDAICNGHNLKADIGDAHGTNGGGAGCGNSQHSGVATVSDPYASLASNIPAYTCSSYSWAPAKKKDPPLPSTNLLQGLLATNLVHICGDAQAVGPVLINQPNTVIVVHGGQLDLNSYTISTNPGASVTFIFTGAHFSGHSHIPTGDGTFDIQAPTTGVWKGVAIYQDPALTSGVDITYAGNSPTWDITGLVYLPHSSVTFSGAVNKSSNGASCFALVVDNVTFNGTGSIMAHGGCAAAGLTMPNAVMPGRGVLVG